MDLLPDDHNHVGMLGHDLPEPCPSGCGWVITNCHC